MQVRCLHCHEPTQVPDESDLSRVMCSACGGSFSLIADRTAPYTPERVRMLGHFELIEQVGVGAFGSVWKARDTRLDRTVAVKIPRKGQLSPKEAEQFLREARAAAQLKHPGIVSVVQGLSARPPLLSVVVRVLSSASLRELLARFYDLTSRSPRP